MKQIILIAIMTLSLGFANAQTKVYKGTSSYSSDVICNLNNDKVYKKTSKLFIRCNL